MMGYSAFPFPFRRFNNRKVEHGKRKEKKNYALNGKIEFGGRRLPYCSTGCSIEFNRPSNPTPFSSRGEGGT